MKQLIPKSFIQDIIARTDIISIIESRIELKKRGHTHIAYCPFHSEKTPSFTVSSAKQFYYCFGCGAHGNAIGFLMEYDHLTFVDAVTDLANQLGITIPIETTDADSTNNDLFFTVLHNAQMLYQNELKKSQIAIDYLKNRGLTGSIAKKFGIGYAPNAWDFLSKQFPQKKEALILSGMLIKKNDGSQPYDRFRDRILFPIRDIRGRTIGFGGRTLTNDIPKYLNSPETPVFHKNQTLYGLYEVSQHHRKLNRALVVEGYLDVISLAQHGIHYAVATLGTALNTKHIQLLLRYTSHVIFCFDGDLAGQKAAWKALTLSLPLLRDGINFQFLFLPEKEDPDSLVQKIGCDAFEKLIDHATALPTVFFDQLEKEYPLDSIAGKAAFAKNAKEYLETMPHGIYKNLLLDQLAEKLSIQRNKLNEEARFIPKKPARKLTARLSPVESAIQLLLHEPALAIHAKPTPALTTSDASPEKSLLIDLIKYCADNPMINMSDILTELKDDMHRECIAMIAVHPLHVPVEGRKAEFIGALKRMHEQDQTQQLSHLISKAKISELDSEEKQLLQLLLAKKHAQKNSEGLE